MSQPHHQTEIEVKVWVDDLAAIEQRLHTLQASLVTPRLYERNVRYEDAQHSLTPADRVLRLRQDNRVRLTYKEPDNITDGIMVRTELEVTVSDFAITDQLLQKLGFSPAWIYEKYRTTYHLNGCEVVLDELPIGTFIEVEGEIPSIAMILQQLGLSHAKRITASYSDLFFRCKQILGVTFQDLTFDNFAGIQLTPSLIDQVIG